MLNKNEIAGQWKAFSSRKKAFVMTCIFLFIFCVPMQAWPFAEFIKTVPFNAFSSGRGGTIVAIGDEPSNMNMNPAVISEVESNLFDTSFNIVIPDIDYKYTGTDNKEFKTSDKDRIGLLPHISYAHNFKGSPWVLGLAASVIDGFGCDYTIQSRYYGPINAFGELLHLRFAPNISYQISPNLSLGLRLALDYGSMDIRLPIGRLFIDLGQCDNFGYSGALGLLYKPTDKLNIGLYYESETVLNDLKTKNRDAYFSLKFDTGTLTYAPMDVILKDVKFPQHFGIGIAYRPSPLFRLSADIRYVDWGNTWKIQGITLNGSDGQLNLVAPFGTQTHTPAAFGLEYFLNDMYALSLGYRYSDECMDNVNMNPLIPGEVQHMITCGISVMPAKNVKFGAALIWGIMDHPNAPVAHAYDDYIEEKFGFEPGFIDSELEASRADYATYNLILSAQVSW